jgi:Rod binding domain-containing protein
MFLSNMFQEMFTGLNGDGPMGGKGALKVWRSFAIDQYAKAFAKAGGIGIAAKVYDTLLKEQGLTAS